jgi:CO dehydrogenase/acetyl-CoA synthase beta subunit
MSEELEDGVAEELNEFLSQHGGPVPNDEAGDEEQEEEEAPEEEAAAEPSTQQVKSRQLIATRVGELAQVLNLSVSKEVLLGTAELVRRYTEVMARDLDAFSDHAKRWVEARTLSIAFDL